MLRRFYKTVAFFIFLATLYVSCDRYFNNVPIQSSHIERFPEYVLPAILICGKNQFDLEAAKEEGYTSFRNFYNGRIDGSSEEDKIDVTWGGLSNMSFNDLKRKLFKSYNDELEIEGNITTRDTFILPQGHCKEIQSISGYQDINPLKITIKNGSFEVFITDITKKLAFKVDEKSITGDRIDFDMQAGITKHKFYELTVTEYNNQPVYCENYKDWFYYAGCIVKEDEKNIEPVLGCIPPWMAGKNNNQDCKTVKQVNRKDYEDLEFNKNYDKVRAGLDYTSRYCKGPCRQVTTRARLFRDFTSISTNKIYIYFKRHVEVTGYIPSFTAGDLLVDIGSNLGLFIGFSLVDLIDFLIAALMKINVLAQ